MATNTTNALSLQHLSAHFPFLAPVEAQACGLYTENDPAEVGKLLGWDGPGPAPSVIIPVFDSMGAQVAISVRPDAPVKRADGTSPKYEWPKNAPSRLYFPPIIPVSDWSNPAVPLLITEGAKKALAAYTANPGLCAPLAGIGVWMFHDANSKRLSKVFTPHPDLAALPLQGRRVFIAFDGGDTSNNVNVIDAETRLGQMLTEAGAIVALIRIPFVSGGPKVGLDDHLVVQPNRALAMQALLHSAIPFNPILRAQLAINSGTSAPVAVAMLMQDVSFAAAIYRHKTYFNDVADTLKKYVPKKHLRQIGTDFAALYQTNTANGYDGGRGGTSLIDLVQLSVQEFHQSPLSYNSITKKIEIDKSAVEMSTIHTELERTGKRVLNENTFPTFREGEVVRAVEQAAKLREYNPVEQYLRSRPHDGADVATVLSRMGDAWCRIIGRDLTPLERTMCINMMVSAVARALDPGCKVDTALVLQGPQGAGKSTLFEKLAVKPEWFSNSHVDLHSKDSQLHAATVWIHEWPEMTTVTRARDVNDVKAFMSASHDTYRPPYGRHIITTPRMSIIVGTTNDQEILRDTTGSRRFWIVPVADKLDIPFVETWRDNLWADALSLYVANHKWWLTAQEDAERERINEQYEVHDSLQESLEVFVASRTEFLMSDVGVIFDKPGLPLSLIEQQRAGRLLRKMGWGIRRKRVNGKMTRLWVRILSDDGSPLPEVSVD